MNNEVSIGKYKYEIVKDYREGFDLEQFKERFVDFFGKYDYIVGDWSAEKLRLRGFYKNSIKNISNDLKYSYVEKYLKEFCAYGCPYFILKSLHQTNSSNIVINNTSNGNKNNDKNNKITTENKNNNNSKNNNNKNNKNNKKNNNKKNGKKHNKNGKKHKKNNHNNKNKG